MTDERNYLLGTHDAEVERLGLQHRVGRSRVLDAWRRAGIRAGSLVIDAGAGPGWASLDLAEIVGPDGRVNAIERSARFIDVLEARAEQRGLDNVETRVAGTMAAPDRSGKARMARNGPRIRPLQRGRAGLEVARFPRGSRRDSRRLHGLV